MYVNEHTRSEPKTAIVPVSDTVLISSSEIITSLGQRVQNGLGTLKMQYAKNNRVKKMSLPIVQISQINADHIDNLTDIINSQLIDSEARRCSYTDGRKYQDMTLKGAVSRTIDNRNTSVDLSQKTVEACSACDKIGSYLHPKTRRCGVCKIVQLTDGVRVIVNDVANQYEKKYTLHRADFFNGAFRLSAKVFTVRQQSGANKTIKGKAVKFCHNHRIDVDGKSKQIRDPISFSYVAINNHSDDATTLKNVMPVFIYDHQKALAIESGFRVFTLSPTIMGVDGE